MTEEVRHRRLARIFINRGFQLRMLRRAVTPLLVSCLALCAALILFTPGESYSGGQLRLAGLVGLALVFLFGAGGVLWSLWLFSSRVAGPLLQLERTLGEMAAGDLTVRMRVRQRDELQEHTRHLNRTIESVQARVIRITQFCDFALRSIEEMQQTDPKNPSLSRMLDLVRSIQESVADFHVR